MTRQKKLDDLVELQSIVLPTVSRLQIIRRNKPQQGIEAHYVNDDSEICGLILLVVKKELENLRYTDE